MAAQYGDSWRRCHHAPDRPEALDKIRESLVATYGARTGLPAATLTNMLDVETWLTAAEAVDLGFSDRVG